MGEGVNSQGVEATHTTLKFVDIELGWGLKTMRVIHFKVSMSRSAILLGDKIFLCSTCKRKLYDMALLFQSNM